MDLYFLALSCGKRALPLKSAGSPILCPTVSNRRQGKTIIKIQGLDKGLVGKGVEKGSIGLVDGPWKSFCRGGGGMVWAGQLLIVEPGPRKAKGPPTAPSRQPPIYATLFSAVLAALYLPLVAVSHRRPL